MYSSPNSSPRVFSPSELTSETTSHSDWSDENDDLADITEGIVPTSSSPPSSSPGRIVTPPTVNSGLMVQVHPFTHTFTETIIYAHHMTDEVSLSTGAGLLDGNAAGPDKESAAVAPSIEEGPGDAGTENSLKCISRQDRADNSDSSAEDNFGERLKYLLGQVVSDKCTMSRHSRASDQECDNSAGTISDDSQDSAASSDYDASCSASSNNDLRATAAFSPAAFRREYPHLATALDRLENSEDNIPVKKIQRHADASNMILHAPGGIIPRETAVVPDACIASSSSGDLKPLSAHTVSKRSRSNEKYCVTKSTDQPDACIRQCRFSGPDKSITASPPAKKLKILVSRLLSTAGDASVKTSSQDVSTPLASNRFASSRASIRKAASLVSETAQLDELDVETPISGVKTGVCPTQTGLTISALSLSSTKDASPASPCSSDIAKTEPVTPVPIDAIAKPSGARSRRARTPLPFPLPVVAPPPFANIPRAPASLEELAERRIAMMLIKEKDERAGDNLDSDVFGPECTTSDDAGYAIDESSDDDMDEEEKELWQDYPTPDHEMIEECRIRDGTQPQDLDVENTPATLALFVCIDHEFLQDIIEWMFDSLPPVFPAKPGLCRELHRELSHCLDTRWHAVQLFIRYFVRIGDASPPCSPSPSQKNLIGRTKLVAAHDENAAFVWDIAIACVALSVKFHRDVLSPLAPVFANEFILLARHCLTFEELETAQRHILEVFDFSIGSVTPGVYMEEIWNALPSLRSLLDTKLLWETVKSLTWEKLLDTPFDIEYMHHHTSTLTACALVQGVSETLVIHKKERRARYEKVTKSRRDARCNCAKISESVSKTLQVVEMDIMELLNVDEDWKACKAWLAALDV